MSFVHLHTHTQYSLLDGSNKIKDYVAAVKNMGMTAAAITDHGVMYGVIDFYRECKDAGINPVLGCEVYVAPGSRFDREQVKGEDRYYHLILLAENNTGYENLMRIVSVGFVDGFYYRPRVDFETLEKYHEGIICLSACLAGEIPRLIEKGDYEAAKATAIKYRDTFGAGNFFLEMQDHGILLQRTVNQAILRMSDETGIPVVATNDCHYTKAEDAAAHDILLCIQTGKKVSDEDRMRYEGGQYYVKSEEEMRQLFPYAPDAISLTQEIADRCHVEIEFGNTKLPHFEVPEGYDSYSYLQKLCYDGLIRRYPNNHEELKSRLDYELETIQTMGYVDYFLIVWDFINYARTHGIPVGPGRGSAAGSLVSYTTGITNIDPIKYSLIFERFLNPERVSMPDIDIDFCYENRHKVIEYVVEKYGKDCVTQIVTFGTLKAKGVLRDVGRVLDMPYSFVDSIAKMVPNDLGVDLSAALKMNREMKDLYDSDPQVKYLIDTAKLLEGLPRNTGMHAAGVVIAAKPMWEYVPLSRGADGTIVTQFTMTTIEQLGLLKMDFLGLRTLTVIADAVKLIKEQHGIDIDVDSIDYDDKAVIESIGTGKCEGIFQLESAGMKSFMKELKAESLEDVIAGISLYRPGPMDFIPNYIRGKNNRSGITYDCPQLEPILASTYGCIVYQEQVMQIVRDLAGYSLGQSDNVRRAMSKKKTAVMEEERQYFVYGNESRNIKGCIANGIDERVANKIYDDMIDFAKYAFNKSHAAAYAVVSYQTAYLKHYYPVEFMAALMTSILDSTDKVSNYIAVCNSMGIEVLPPDVNYGDGRFSVQDGKIRYGMYAVKSVGRPTIDSIYQERVTNGLYTSLDDFVRRVARYDVNKRTIENLIKSGAMDSLPGNRRQKCLAFPAIVDGISSQNKTQIAGQISFLDMTDDSSGDKLFASELPVADEFDKEMRLSFEKELLGVYVSGHPLDDYREMLEKSVTAVASDFALGEAELDSQDTGVGDAEAGEAPSVSDGAVLIIGGMISAVTKKFTKNNQTMAFVTLEDLFGTVEVIVFPRDYEKNRELLTEGNKVFIRGRASVEEDKDAKLICSEVRSFDSFSNKVWIRFANKEEYEKSEAKLFELIEPMDGKDSVNIYISDTKNYKQLGPAHDILANATNISILKKHFGEENVEVKASKVQF